VVDIASPIAVLFKKLNAFDLMLVVVWLMWDLIGQIWIHQAEFLVVIFIAFLFIKCSIIIFNHRTQSILTLVHASLAKLIAWDAPNESTVLFVD
jgi:thiol:disulfide interchange protein